MIKKIIYLIKKNSSKNTSLYWLSALLRLLSFHSIFRQKSHLSSILIPIILTSISACHFTTPPSNYQTNATTPKQTSQTQAKQAKKKKYITISEKTEIQKWLLAADVAYDQGALICKPNECNLTNRPPYALDYYQKILSIDPTNEHSIRKIEQITEKLLSKALNTAIYQSKNAWLFLKQAKYSNPSHPNLIVTEKKVNFLMSAIKKKYTLSTESLHSNSTNKSLHAIGKFIKQYPNHVFIHSQSDKIARSLYLKLNQAEGKHRIKAEIVPKQQTNHEIIFFINLAN